VRLKPVTTTMQKVVYDREIPLYPAAYSCTDANGLRGKVPG
jgi:hypothetical protein